MKIHVRDECSKYNFLPKYYSTYTIWSQSYGMVGDWYSSSDRPNFRFGRTSAELSDKGKVQKFRTKEGVRPIFGQFLAKFGKIIWLFDTKILGPFLAEYVA